MPRLEIGFSVSSIALFVAHPPVALGVLLFLSQVLLLFFLNPLLDRRVHLWLCLEVPYLLLASLPGHRQVPFLAEPLQLSLLLLPHPAGH